MFKSTRKIRLSSIKAIQKRKYAINTRETPAKKGGDPKLENMRAALYPPTRLDRSTAPTGLHRPDAPAALERVITSPEAHETIQRAWVVWSKNKRDAREAELKRKFECMKRAMDDLEQTDATLYRIATSKPDPRAVDQETAESLKEYRGAERRALEARVEGLFPRDLRIPTDTPSRDGWNYDWTPPLQSSEKPGGF
jgi:large subunit ribosomal protein L40